LKVHLDVVLTFEAPHGAPYALGEKHTDTHYELRDMHEMFRRHGAGHCVDMYERFRRDSCYLLNDTVYKAPPCRRMIHVYGINVNTPLAFFLKHKHAVELLPGKGAPSSCGIEFDKHAPSPQDQNYQIKDGVLYETRYTKPRRRGAAAAAGRPSGHDRCSGDGVCPYASLSYSAGWDSPSFRSDYVEIDGAVHREILADARLHSVMLNYLAETLTCYVLEGEQLLLPPRLDGQCSPYVIVKMFYGNGSSSPEHQTQVHCPRCWRSLHSVAPFATPDELGACVPRWGGSASASGACPSLQVHRHNPSPDFKEVVAFGGDVATALRGAVGVEFLVMHRRKHSYHTDIVLGCVTIPLYEVAASPTRAVQGLYPLLHPETGAALDQGGALRLHLELESAGQSYVGQPEHVAMAMAMDMEGMRALTPGMVAPMQRHAVATRSDYRLGS
jgi:hypothetical protein